MSGLVYPSAEHAYQAAKSLDPLVRHRVAATASPYAAKKLGKAPQRGGIVVLRADWEDIKLEVMRGIVAQKFRHPAYREQLIGTGAALLEEGNAWGDTFWGVCQDRGENWLGRILMEERAGR